MKPKLNDFTVAPRWPYPNRRVPWASIPAPGQENNGGEGDNEGGDDASSGDGKGQKAAHML